MYNMNTEEEKIVKLLTKKESTFEDLKSGENASAIKTSEILSRLERKNIVNSMWKHELLINKGKNYTRINRIYTLTTNSKKLISNSPVFNTIKCANKSKQKMLGGKNTDTKK